MSAETLLDGRQLCQTLGLSKLTLRRRVKEGTIPAIKIGRLVRYDRADVMAALRASKVSVALAAVDGREVTTASKLVPAGEVLSEADHANA